MDYTRVYTPDHDIYLQFKDPRPLFCIKCFAEIVIESEEIYKCKNKAWIRKEN